MQSSRTEFTMTVRWCNNSPPFSSPFQYFFFVCFVELQHLEERLLPHFGNDSLGSALWCLLVRWWEDLCWRFLGWLRNHCSVLLQPWQSSAEEQIPAFLLLHFIAQIPFFIPTPAASVPLSHASSEQEMHHVVLPEKATNMIHRDDYVPDFRLSPQTPGTWSPSLQNRLLRIFRHSEGEQTAI